jgi:NADH dehydrogenase
VGFAKRLPFIPVLGNGKARVAPVFVEDLAEICERSLDFPKKAHEAVEVGGPQILTMNDIQKSLLHFFNKKKPLIHSPLWFMRGVGAIFQALLPTPPLTAEAIDFLNMDCPVSSRAVEDLFGIKMTALEDALATYATK